MSRKLPYANYPNQPDREYPVYPYDAGYSTTDDPYPQYVLDADLTGALSGLQTKYARIDQATHQVLDGNGNPVTGSGGGAVASVNAKTGIVALTADDIPDGTSYKTMTLSERTKLSGIPSSAYLLTRSNHTGTQSLDTTTDGADRLAMTGAERTKLAGLVQNITSINGNPGDAAGTVFMDLDSLIGVNIDPVLYDINDVEVPGTGPQQTDFLTYDKAVGAWVNRTPTEFAPAGWVPPYTLRGYVLPVGGTVPPDLPDNALIIDQSIPPRPLSESVNTVLTAGSAQTLPPVTTARFHDLTLTAGVCTLTFPTPIPGQELTLLLRQDATGSRTVAWPATAKFPTGGAPALVTTATADDLFHFVCMAGSNWRMSGHQAFGASTAVAGSTPTVRGTFAANSGASNSVTTLTSTYPTGIVSGDIAYMLCWVQALTDTMTTPSGWTLVDGPSGTSAMRGYLFTKVLAGTESGTTVTSGTVSAPNRPGMTGIVIAGGSTTGIQVSSAAVDTTVDIYLDVPAVTPTVANSIIINMSIQRFNLPATSPTVTAAAGWHPERVHNEGRAVDGTTSFFGGFIQTLSLTGQANVAQGGSTVTAGYNTNATDISYSIAVPPPVS